MPNLLDLDREFLINLLNTFVANITFTKVDGTIRAMRCSRKTEIISLSNPHSSELAKPLNKTIGPGVARPQSVISVFDLDAGLWKSFRVDHLLTISVESNEAPSAETPLALESLSSAENALRAAIYDTQQQEYDNALAWCHKSSASEVIPQDLKWPLE